MPTAVSTGGGTNQQTRNRGSERQVLPVVPFIRASAEHREGSGVDTARLLTASAQDLGVFDIPAYGYLRSLILLVQATGGAGTAVTHAEDGPWNALTNIAVTEPNGAVIAQFNSGYELYLANKWGGYRHASGADPLSSPAYTVGANTTGNFQYILRIPLEINLRDGLGALPNQNAAATFKLRLTQNSTTNIYGTVPSTPPSLRIRVFTEAWDQPESLSGGATNQVTPPALNTTQFWSSQIFNVSAGAQTIRLTRVGNYIRNLIFILRRAGTSRVNGQIDWPDPTTLYLDTRPLDIVEKTNWAHQMFERTGFGGSLGNTGVPGGGGGSVPAYDSGQGLSNGVFVYDFMHEFDGGLGRENRDLWLPTLGSTRLEIQGSFTTAGVLTVLTNDVAVAGSVFI